MNLSSLLVLGGVAVDGWLVALVALRGRRTWLQATYAACALSFLVAGVASVGRAEGVLANLREDMILGLLLLTHALTAILVLGLIHGETLPRRRAATFLLLVPVPILAALAPGQGWTAAAAYEGNPLGGFLVLCLGFALAEAIYARRASPMFGTQAFWLTVGVVSLFVGGPVYAYELDFLRYAPLVGGNLAAPLALVCFARVALQTDPFPIGPRPRRGRSVAGGVGVTDAIVFEERRPKYALRTAQDAASTGRAALLVSRKRTADARTGLNIASFPADRQVGLRTLTTASEFLAASPGGLVVLEDFADIGCLASWSSARELAVRLRYLARDTHSMIALSPDRLTESERASLRDLGLPWWRLPDPAEEIVAILSETFGPGAGRLLESFCRSRGLRRDDVTFDHVPAIQDFLSRSVRELSGAIAGPASEGLGAQCDVAIEALRAFVIRTAEEVARGPWPSQRAAGSDMELVVTASDYWKGKEMEELFAAAETVSEQEPWFEKARVVFVEQLGDAGEGVLRAQLVRLGKKPEELNRTDLVRIADRATVELGSAADVVDIPEQRARMKRQIESIRQQLELLAEGSE
ncbi:MAG TPA: hypothetical protein VNO76_05175 [Thermoplasmata archaeon]|nr:hypothetical protein [Thermoplasmata archaeon]